MNKTVYIFDVDGTLYSLTRMRICMAIKLGLYYSAHLSRINELKAIKLFRQYREKEEFKNNSIEELEEIVALKLNLDINKVINTITRWMFEIPIDIIRSVSYKDVSCFINETQREGDKVIIYSDYPANDKINAMGIKPDYVISSDDESVKELKPSIKAMKYILSLIDIPKDNFIYIGDRYCKDGKSAELVNIKYMDIKQFRKHIKE